MAAITTLHVTNHADFIPQVWASRMLMSLYRGAPVLNMVSRDWENEIASQGDTININKPGTLEVKDKTPGQSVDLQAPEGDKVQVVLAYHKYIAFVVEDVLKAQSSPDVMDTYIQEGGLKIAKTIETIVLTTAYANAQHQVGSSANTIREVDITSARYKLNQNGVEAPDTDRHLVVRDFQPMLTIDRFTSADKLGMSKIPEGMIGRLHGFNSWESPRVVEVAGSPSLLHNLAFHKSGIAFVTRPLPLPPPGTGVASYTMNQKGVGVRVLYGYNMNAVGMQVHMDILFGVKVVRPEFVVDIATKPETIEDFA